MGKKESLLPPLPAEHIIHEGQRGPSPRGAAEASLGGRVPSQLRIGEGRLPDLGGPDQPFASPLSLTAVLRRSGCVTIPVHRGISLPKEVFVPSTERPVNQVTVSWGGSYARSCMCVFVCPCGQ